MYSAEAADSPTNYHLWLVAGPPNVGKTTLVEQLVKMLNGQIPQSAAFARKVTTKRPRAAEDPALQYLNLNDFLGLESDGHLFYSGDFAGAKYGVRKGEIEPLDRDRFLVTASDQAFTEILERANEERIPTVPILLVTSTGTLADRAIAERPSDENVRRLPSLGQLAKAFETNSGFAKYVIDTTSLGDLIRGTSLQQDRGMELVDKLGVSSMVAKLDQLAAIVNLERTAKMAEEKNSAGFTHTYFETRMRKLFGKSVAELVDDGKATFLYNTQPQQELESNYSLPFLATRIAGFAAPSVIRNNFTLEIEFKYTTSTLGGLRRSMVEYDRSLEQEAVFAMFQHALNHKGYRTKNTISFRLTDRLPVGHDELCKVLQPIYTVQVSFANGEGNPKF